MNWRSTKFWTVIVFPAGGLLLLIVYLIISSSGDLRTSDSTVSRSPVSGAEGQTSAGSPGFSESLSSEDADDRQKANPTEGTRTGKLLSGTKPRAVGTTTRPASRQVPPVGTWESEDGELPLEWNSLGETPRLPVEQKQWVEASLTFPGGQPGDKIRVEMLDGGILENEQIGHLLSLDKNLSVAVSAKMSPNPGIHRVRVTAGTDSYVLKYWAGEPMEFQTAENNPNK